MLKVESASMNAKCKLSNNGETIMTLSGSLNENGKYLLNRYIENPELYNANRALMDTDEEEFVSLLLSKINQTGDEN